MVRLNIKALLLNLAIPLAVGFTASLFTRPEIAGWYQTLNKPSFTPPNFVFPLVWTTLYICMGVAFYLVWQRRQGLENLPRLTAAYGAQLVLNFMWSLLFFKMHQPAAALFDIGLLAVAIVLCIVLFYRVSRAAAWLMVPYLAWALYAAAINTAVWRLN